MPWLLPSPCHQEPHLHDHIIAFIMGSPIQGKKSWYRNGIHLAVFVLKLRDLLSVEGGTVRSNLGGWWLLGGPRCQYLGCLLIAHHGLVWGRLLVGNLGGSSAPGPWFNIKMSSYQYRKSHCGDKRMLRPSYLHNEISYTGKTACLHWIRPQILFEYFWIRSRF